MCECPNNTEAPVTAIQQFSMQKVLFSNNKLIFYSIASQAHNLQKVANKSLEAVILFCNKGKSNLYE